MIDVYLEKIKNDIVSSGLVTGYGGLCYTAIKDGITFGYSGGESQSVYGPTTGESIAFLETNRVYTRPNKHVQRIEEVVYSMILHNYYSRNAKNKLSDRQYNVGVNLYNHIFKNNGIAGPEYESLSLLSAPGVQAIDSFTEYTKIFIDIVIPLTECIDNTFKIEEECC